MDYFEDKYVGDLFGAKLYSSLKEKDKQYARYTLKSVYGEKVIETSSRIAIDELDNASINYITRSLLENIAITNYEPNKLDNIRGRMAFISDLCNVKLPQNCYNKNLELKATIVDVQQEGEQLLYLCEFPNQERKWINSKICRLEKYNA